MPEPRETHGPGHLDGPPTGRHGLGPHVVGRRVVVRRVVRGERGPSGGPAMTDVLGTCLSWSDGLCVVRPDRTPGAEPVAIAVGDIVSGKPVPPRAPARARVDPREAQVHGFALFPDLHTEALGAWVLRRSATAGARRANSVLAFGPSGLDGGDAAALDRVVAWYDRPIAAVLSGSPQAELLLGLGWRPESGDADTVFCLTGTAALARAVRAAARPARGPVGGSDDVQIEEDGDLLTAGVGAAASGVAALDGDWVGFRSIAVDEAHRRRGLALALMSALVDRAAEHGATTAFLQVLADNAPALALYERLGFVEHHRYRYLVPPGA